MNTAFITATCNLELNIFATLPLCAFTTEQGKIPTAAAAAVVVASDPVCASIPVGIHRKIRVKLLVGDMQPQSPRVVVSLCVRMCMNEYLI